MAEQTDRSADRLATLGQIAYWRWKAEWEANHGRNESAARYRESAEALAISLKAGTDFRANGSPDAV